MNMIDQLNIQAMYDRQASREIKPAAKEKPRSTLGPVNALQAQKEAEAAPETPAPVKRGRPRKAAS